MPALHSIPPISERNWRTIEEINTLCSFPSQLNIFAAWSAERQKWLPQTVHMSGPFVLAALDMSGLEFDSQVEAIQSALRMVRPMLGPSGSFIVWSNS